MPALSRLSRVSVDGVHFQNQRLQSFEKSLATAHRAKDPIVSLREISPELENLTLKETYERFPAEKSGDLFSDYEKESMIAVNAQQQVNLLVRNAKIDNYVDYPNMIRRSARSAVHSHKRAVAILNDIDKAGLKNVKEDIDGHNKIISHYAKFIEKAIPEEKKV